MKALIVTALAGFIRSFLKNDIAILQSMGYEVHCAANINHAGADGLDKFFNDVNVVFHQINFSSSKPFSKETLKSYKELKKLINGIQFDVVHCHTPIAGALTRIACKSKRKKGCKVLYTTHGYYFHKGSGWKSWLIFYNIEKIMSRYTDAVITINHEDFNIAKKMHCKNVYCIPGVGVNTERFINTTIDREEYREKIGVKKEDFLVLAVGELSNRKNHQIIIRALAECNIPNAVFMICGNAMTSENTKEKLESLVKELNVDLRLTGLRKDIAEICKCADIGVLPSTREGLGLAGIEMLASGLPVVASNVQGIVDYIEDGKNGYLCDPYDAHAFAEAIIKLLPLEARNKMTKTCIESSKKFDKKYSNTAMENIYNKVLHLKQDL